MGQIVTVDGVQETINSLPPVAVVGMTFMGLTLEQWVYLTTIVYTLAQLSWFLYKKVYPEVRRAIDDRTKKNE